MLHRTESGDCRLFGSEVQSNEIRLLRLMLRLELKLEALVAATAGSRANGTNPFLPYTWGGAAMNLFRAEYIAALRPVDPIRRFCRESWLIFPRKNGQG